MNRAERRKKAKNFTMNQFEQMENQLRWAIKKECKENVK